MDALFAFSEPALIGADPASACANRSAFVTYKCIDYEFGPSARAVIGW